jgi:hypothetical protein
MYMYVTMHVGKYGWMYVYIYIYIYIYIYMHLQRYIRQRLIQQVHIFLMVNSPRQRQLLLKTQTQTFSILPYKTINGKYPPVMNLAPMALVNFIMRSVIGGVIVTVE